MAVETYMTETEAREWARHYGENPSWYWDAQQRSHVLIADGVTTPGDMGVEIASGRGDPAAVADYFVMAAQLLSARARFTVDAARQRDIAESTVDSQADLAAAEAHHAATHAQLADLEMTAEDLHYTAEVQRIKAEEAHDDLMAELAQRNDEVLRVHHLISDKEHFASFCQRDGAAEDNYSDQTWEAAETLVDSGHTAQSIKAERNAAASAYPQPTPDEGKGANELWARLNAAPPQVQEQFWLVHPRPDDPDITEAMLTGAYAAVGLDPAAMPASELIGADRSDQEYEAELDADELAMWTALQEHDRWLTQQLINEGRLPPSVAPGGAYAHAPAADEGADLAAGEAEDLANAERAQAAWEYEGDQRSLWEELGASPPEVRAAFWGARDAAGSHAGHAMSPAELGAAYLDAGLPVPERPRAVPAEDSTSAPDRAVAHDPHDHALHHGGGEDLPFAAEYPGNPDASRRRPASTVVAALPGSSDTAVPGISAGQSAYSALAAVLDELDQARTRLEAGDVPAEREHQQAEYIEHLEYLAGKSADDVLAELTADLDATGPDPYPGDDAYAAQILHDALYYESPPVAAEQAAGFAAYAQMSAQEAHAEYDRDLEERTERDQSAPGRTQGCPAEAERSPGQPSCAGAVAAAHEAVRADAQRVTEELERDQPARAHTEGRQRGTVAGQQSAMHEGGDSNE